MAHIAPASHQQRRLWVAQQLFPGTASYSSPVVYEIWGDLDVPALEQAVRNVVAHHPSLRTRLVMIDGELVQETAATGPDVLAGEWVTARALAAIDADLRAAARQPIDPGTAPLFDFRLYRSVEGSWLFYVNLHHAITDRHSTSVLIDDIGSEYAALRDGKPGAPAAPGPSYADFARRQHDQRDSPAARDRLEYWTGQLAGVPPLTGLPLDRPRPARQSLHGAIAGFALPEELTAEVTALARQLRTSRYTVLLAAFALLLHRYCGEPDLVLGTPVTSRPSAGFDRTVGFFANVVPLRSRYEPTRSFAEYVAQVSRTAIGAFRHQDVPFDALLRRLGIPAAISHNPLIQVVFTYQDQPAPGLALDGTRVRTQVLPTGSVQFDLELELAPSASGGLDGQVWYSTDLFDEATAARLAENYRWLVGEVARRPQATLSSLRVVGQAEQDKVRRWNQTSREFPAACLHELFEDQVRRTPNATAVVFGEESLRYRGLDDRAESFAGFLRGHGIGPDQVVAVAVPRSLDLVIALIGILKAGGAYLPVDPAMPAARLEATLRDAGTTVLVVAEDQAIGPFGGITTVTVGAGATGAPPARPRVRPGNLVSVYYTSGSTGMPKGVASHHRGWVNRMTWMQRKHGLREGETVLHKTTLTFDDAALEIFWPLSAGGRIAMLEPEAHRDPKAILTALTRYRCVYLQVVPSMLSAMLDLLDDRPELAPTTLANTTSSGEALQPELAARFARLLPGRLHNTWGATEVSIDSTCHTCGPSDERDDPDAGRGAVTLGRPFDNNTVYVLDADLQQVPIGAVGELYIGGVGLARGYLNDPARTARAFVPDPFGTGDRLYATGDRGLMRPDGRLEFAGRTDHQVKIRGMRVELGEIEATLVRHPRVAEAVARIDASRGQQRLVAFVTTAAEQSRPQPGELLDFARQWLPDHMVPVQLVVLDAFPLNANGKTDRAALVVPADLPARDRAEPCATDAERFVADLWTDLLGVPDTSALDDFFLLGGHSLAATQFVARVRKRLGVELPLVTVYAERTVRGVAAEIQNLVLAELMAMTDSEAERRLGELA